MAKRQKNGIRITNNGKTIPSAASNDLKDFKNENDIASETNVDSFPLFFFLGGPL